MARKSEAAAASKPSNFALPAQISSLMTGAKTTAPSNRSIARRQHLRQLGIRNRPVRA
jgi:hypothetical protein